MPRLSNSPISCATSQLNIIRLSWPEAFEVRLAEFPARSKFQRSRIRRLIGGEKRRRVAASRRRVIFDPIIPVSFPPSLLNSELPPPERTKPNLRPILLDAVGAPSGRELRENLKARRRVRRVTVNRLCVRIARQMHFREAAISARIRHRP